MKTYYQDADRFVQLDVMDVNESTVVCNMYTGVLCVKVSLTREDYDALVRKGFFIRDGKIKDSANVINTTETYYITNVVSER